MRIDFGLELAPVCRADLEMMRNWRNDHRVWRYCRQSDLISDVEQTAWFERQAADPAIKMYVIIRRVDGNRQAVGVCGLTSIDMLCRRAELSMYIGPEHHRKGFGREAFKLLLTHGFLNLGMNCIWIETIGVNPAGDLFDELGFKAEGIRRSFYFKDGQFVDAHLYSILRDEWISGQLASLPGRSPACSPTPSSSVSGSPKGAMMEETQPSQQSSSVKGQSPQEDASRSQSVTSGLGSLSKRRRDEALANSDAVARWLLSGSQGEGYDALRPVGQGGGKEGSLASGIEDPE